MVQTISKKHVLLTPSGVLTQDESRFLRLPHPRTLQPALFVPAPSTSTASDAPRDQLLELQAVKPDSDKARSYFVEQEVLSDGTLSILTPFDPVFLLIALLSALPPHFLPLDELWDSASQLPFASPLEKKSKNHEEEEDEDKSFGDDIVRFGQLDCVRHRMQHVCETQEHDGAFLYRLSSPLVMKTLKSKIDLLTDPVTGIFGPLENVELGRLSETRKSDEETAAGSETPTEVGTPELKAGEKAPTEVGTPELKAGEKVYPTVSRGLGREGVGDGQGMSAEIQIETRAKSVLGILSNYLPPATSHLLLADYSFPALTKHLSTQTKSSVLSSTYLPGRSSSSASLGDEESSGNGGGAAAAAAKKKKAAAKGSRGVEILKKVNVKGMKTMDSFFTKAPAKKRKAD